MPIDQNPIFTYNKSLDQKKIHACKTKAIKVKMLQTQHK